MIAGVKCWPDSPAADRPQATRIRAWAGRSASESLNSATATGCAGLSSLGASVIDYKLEQSFVITSESAVHCRHCRPSTEKCLLGFSFRAQTLSAFLNRMAAGLYLMVTVLCPRDLAHSPSLSPESL